MNIIDCTITHILTQLTGRWIPPAGIAELNDTAILQHFSISLEALSLPLSEVTEETMESGSRREVCRQHRDRLK